MAFNAGTILARLKLDSRKFTAGIKKAGRDTKAFTSKIATLKTAIGAAFGFLAVRQIARFGEQLFRLADQGGK